MTSAEKKRVLIVDDERVIADTLVTIFSAEETRHQGSWRVRLSDFFAWGMTHMRFRSWKGGR